MSGDKCTVPLIRWTAPIVALVLTLSISAT